MRKVTLSVATTALLLTGACGGAEPQESSAAATLTFWTPHTTPDRLAVQQSVAAKFTSKTGIKVEVVPLESKQASQSLVTGAASGTLPDVILYSPNLIAAWNAQGLMDTEAPRQIVDELGADTFTESAIRMATVGGKLGAVPSDGWGHVISYRKDLFKSAGLEAPESVEDIVTAAQKLAKDGVRGIAMGTQPGDGYTGEGLESLLQAAGCQLVTNGTVAIDSPECVTGLDAVQKLGAAAGTGELDVGAARAAYLAGDAAMLLFSSHIVDEVAGLDKDNPVTCQECKKDATYLAENTGFVTALGTAPQYGQTSNYAIPRGASVENAKKFVSFAMSEGYVEMLSTAAEGRIPMRPGPAKGSTEYLDAWADLPVGNDPATKKSIKAVYGEDVVDQLAKGAASFGRWGWGTDDATLAGVVFSQGTLSKELGPLFSGTSPADVAKKMAAEVDSVKQDLGE
ncbi:ABC transporter substrate-binding protein [Nonomuraea diastatica]|uniref:Extracellular solute-binding protein n=1 Tax=Nonomuraea diastatica TaxID=1848329 RepID=A0A4R4WJH3_9ACTN|nr:extracellular solute-binding protein [Nonomuraea diastatica]TDD19172.1 extracellular solute-binding protein [Nonomuraea diastatica]